MSEQEDSLIEQLRSYGISLEDLEGLIRGKYDRSQPPIAPDATAEGRPDALITPGAFDSLVDPTDQASNDGYRSVERSGFGERSGVAEDQLRFDALRIRDLAIAEAKEAAAEIRASAVKLVTEKLQAAEDEVMSLRAKAAEDVATLRTETSRAMIARLQDAEHESELLRSAAREETRLFWESAYREFSNAKEQMAKVRAKLSDLVADMSDAVSTVEAAAGSIAELCAKRLSESDDSSGAAFGHGDTGIAG